MKTILYRLAKTMVDVSFLENRKDLTDLDIITIDGENTKDFDDALSISVTEEVIYSFQFFRY